MTSDYKEKINDLYDKYNKVVKNYISSSVFNYSDADQIASEVWLVICKSYPTTFDSSKPFEPWLYTVARSKISDFFRKRYLKSEVKFEDMRCSDGSNNYLCEPFAKSLEPIETMQNDEKYRELRFHINNLSEVKKACVMMKYFDQMSIKDIADFLGSPEGTIKSRLSSAKEELKERLDQSKHYEGQ